MIREKHEPSSRVKSPKDFAISLQLMVNFKAVVELQDGDRFDVRLVGIRTPTTSIVSFSSKCRFGIIEPGNRESIDVWITSKGEVRYQAADFEKQWTQGSVNLVNGRSPMHLNFEFGCDVQLISLPRSLVSAAASQILNHNVDVDIESIIVNDKYLPQFDTLSQLMSQFQRVVENNPRSLMSWFVSRRIEEFIISYLIDYLGRSKLADERFTHKLPLAVKAAMEAISGSTEPITVQQLANLVGLTTRGLQIAFMKSLGETPHDVLKRSRLSKLRYEMISNPEKPIKSVAHYWGFSNYSRLKESYIHQYGEDDWKRYIIRLRTR